MDEQRVTQQPKPSYLRILRNGIKTALPFVGVLTVLGAVFFIREIRLQMAVVVVGLLLLEGGVWNMAQTMLPSERKYLFLRAELDSFIGLVHQLNKTALEIKAAPSDEKQLAFERTRNAMLVSVDRMAAVAGQTDTDIAEDLANVASQDAPDECDVGYRS